MGQKVRNSDLTHLTWTYERELSKLQEKWGWEGVAPVLPNAIDDTLVEEVVENGLAGERWWVDDEGPQEVTPSSRCSLEKEVEWLLRDQCGEVMLEKIRSEGDEQPETYQSEDYMNDQGALKSEKSAKVSLCFYYHSY